MKKIVILVLVFSSVYYGCSKNTPTPQNTPQSIMVATYAGNGTAGLQNGQPPAAEFSLPSDVAIDGNGDVFISEQGNNVIRAVMTSGQVITYAGNGSIGYKDGAAASAEFNDPQGLAIDVAGNLYVADAGNNVIRMISTTGQVSTYAGNGTPGYKDGANGSAEFNRPMGLAIDKARNIYVADYLNNVIRKISAGKMVNTYAGNGSQGENNSAAATSTFNAPAGVALDGAGNLFVADQANNAIREIATGGGQVSTFAGSIKTPVRVAVDASGNVYFTASNNTVQEITSSGTVSTYAGNGTPGLVNGAPLTAEFNGPTGLYVNPAGSAVLVADYNNNVLRIIAL